MKKLIYSIAAFFIITLCSAQQPVAQAEYFWDNDPGMGLGTAISATDGTFNNAFEQLSKTGIVLPAVGLHVFNIRIKDNTGGWGPVFRNVISVQTSLDTNDIELRNLTAFPNPVTNILNITLDREITSLSIYNFMGQEVMTKSLNATETALDLSALATGSYFVKVNSGNFGKVIKIIKE